MYGLLVRLFRMSTSCVLMVIVDHISSQGMGEHLLGGIVDVICPQHIFKVTNY